MQLNDFSLHSFRRFIGQKMYKGITKYCQTCDVCLRTNRNYQFKTKPLNPLDPPDAPFQQYHLDLDLDNSRQEPEAITVTSGCALGKSGEPTLEGRYCVGLSN